MSAIPPVNAINLQQHIDTWHESRGEGPRFHIGASILGHPCDRWIWLSFRWAVKENVPGRILRLFRRGKREEETIAEDLRGAGIVIHHCGDEAQCRVDFGCHVSGSVDGIIESGVPGAEKTRHVAEFKTHSLKSFRELQTKGVRAAKEQHWCQMQVYMLGTGIERALYVAVCKDNDEIYAERVYFDEAAAGRLVRRGQSLALEERIPAPLSSDPAWWQCKYCPAYSFCFKTRCSQEINCRTCCHVTPKENGTFTCALDNGETIPQSLQVMGCERHVMHPDLVPWTWKGGTPNGKCAIYEWRGQTVANGAAVAGGIPTAVLLGQEEFKKKDTDIPF